MGRKEGGERKDGGMREREKNGGKVYETTNVLDSCTSEI